MPRLVRGGDAAVRHRRQAYDRQRRVRAAIVNTCRRIFIVRELAVDVAPFCVGGLDNQCPHCAALRFPGEKLNCCHNGKVLLAPLSPYPPELQLLLTSGDSASRNFLDNIRQYNSAFAFASMSASVHHYATPGPYCFRIHGQVHHRAGTLHPSPGVKPRYGQMYILEGRQALDARLQDPHNAGCTESTMGIIQGVLETNNTYAVEYKHMHEIEREAAGSADISGTPLATVRMVIKRGHDQRRYNEPRHDEVAAVFVGDDGAPPVLNDIVIYPRDRPLSNLSYMSANCDPMVYPLLFPRGDLGWVQGTLHVEAKRTPKRQTVTLLQYYAYRIAIREPFSPVHCSGKLFQQYLVDAYVKAEASRLDFLRRNQSTLRVEKYRGLMDHMHTASASQTVLTGKVVILPSSYSGSPRAMQQNYQDAMAIVCKYGKPDIFLTFTCNPKLQEITGSLGPRQYAQDRPDLVARVFKRHLKDMSSVCLLRMFT